MSHLISISVWREAARRSSRREQTEHVAGVVIQHDCAGALKRQRGTTVACPLANLDHSRERFVVLASAGVLVVLVDRAVVTGTR
jgi:hypothetical protein